jgi:uncharacterized damage-inducible protein DinB
LWSGGIVSAERPEPWLRETLTDVPPIARAVLHSLEHAKEDLTKWCGGLTDEQLSRSVDGIAPVAFQLRHVARSVDRLLTYAEGGALSDEQMRALQTEMDRDARREELFAELTSALTRGAERVRALADGDLAQERFIGRKRIETTLGGLLVHTAEHTQRHVGQAIVIAKVVSRASKL